MSETLSIVGFWRRRSHTLKAPSALAVARMCCTLVFHARAAMPARLSCPLSLCTTQPVREVLNGRGAVRTMQPGERGAGTWQLGCGLYGGVHVCRFFLQLAQFASHASKARKHMHAQRHTPVTLPPGPIHTTHRAAVPTGTRTRMAGYRLGCPGSLMSQMSNSPPPAPLASRLGLRELNSSPRTAAEWFCSAARGGADAEGERLPLDGGEERMSAGFHTAMVPSDNPPARMPYCTMIRELD